MKTPWMTRQKQIDENLFALAVLDRAAHDADNDRRYFDYDMALHKVRLTPLRSARQQHDQHQRIERHPEIKPDHQSPLGTRPRGPHRKAVTRERYCGSTCCQPGLNGKCTACGDDK